MSVLHIGNFICILLCSRLVLIEFFNILNWVNTQIRCITKLLETIHNPLQDFHDLLCQLETAESSRFQCIRLTLVQTDSETLLPVKGYLAITNDCSCEVTDHGGACVTGCSYHLHHYTWWTRCFARLVWEIAFLTISVVFGMGGPSTGGNKKKVFESAICCHLNITDHILNDGGATLVLTPLTELLPIIVYYFYPSCSDTSGLYLLFLKFDRQLYYLLKFLKLLNE